MGNHQGGFRKRVGTLISEDERDQTQVLFSPRSTAMKSPRIRRSSFTSSKLHSDHLSSSEAFDLSDEEQELCLPCIISNDDSSLHSSLQTGSFNNLSMNGGKRRSFVPIQHPNPSCCQTLISCYANQYQNLQQRNPASAHPPTQKLDTNPDLSYDFHTTLFSARLVSNRSWRRWLFLLFSLFILYLFLGKMVPMSPLMDLNRKIDPFISIYTNGINRLADDDTFLQKYGWNDELWSSKDGLDHEQCIEPTTDDIQPLGKATNGYILVNANGGLNQMRAGICDMVAVARIMNATLVIPHLDDTSFWADPSEFEDIFDVEHFIEVLRDYVHIVETLPPSLQNVTPYYKTPISWSQVLYYKEDVLPLLKQHKVLYFTHADSRLANNGLPDSVQHLRCRANYLALQFVQPIMKVAESLIQRIRQKNDPYIALHLRYEKDMLAFTGCTHGLMAEEAEQLREMRYQVQHWKEKEIDGEERRLMGGCPLTPHETGLLLKGLGYPLSTKIYIVAGNLFGNASMLSLKKHFPNVFTHSDLTSEEELAHLREYQNRLAGIDYILAVKSDVFMYTYDGNMAKMVQGHRFFEGYHRTISPDRQNLVRLVDAYESQNITWAEFESQVKNLHANRTGAPYLREPGEFPKLEESFYANPYPGCICKKKPVNRRFLTREA